MVKVNLQKKPQFNLNKPPNQPQKAPPNQNNSPWNFPGLPQIEPCPQGLVPIGNTGFYMTPGHPISPTDCNLWPSSPYCGGNPINWGNFIGINFTIIHDNCNIGVQFTPTFGFISLPPLTVVWRDPNCIVDPPSPPIIIDDIEVETSCGFYMMPYTFYLPTLQIKKVLSVTKISQSYVFESSLVEDWDIYYKDCNDVTRKLTRYPFNHFKHYVAYSLEKDAQGNSYQKRIPPIKKLNYGCPCGTAILPPPPPNFPCCMPQCCPPQNDALLQLLLEKLEKLSQIVGVSEYPINVPASLNADLSNSQAQIENLSEFISYFIKQFDAVVGQFPIEIEIEDTDLTQAGNQTAKLKLPNLAETLTEMFGTTIINQTTSNAILSAATRTLIEAGAAKQEALMTYKAVDAIVEYLAFKTKQVSIKVPFAFNPTKEKLHELLKETEMQVKVIENADDKDLNDYLTELLKAASIITAVFWRRLDPKKDMGKQFVDIIKASAQFLDKININQDLEPFIDEAEAGFDSTPGQASKPYGRDYERRPKITDKDPPQQGA